MTTAPGHPPQRPPAEVRYAVVQGGAATTEDQIKYSWNYALPTSSTPPAPPAPPAPGPTT
ncbi:hypothetical protein [Kitasatospora terrestris]|uniref:Uncharacterized protein n=1 Tax=Kitasatospora terrestris TaxID=258051 RepID=A0ABP9D878_9ACTN